MKLIEVAVETDGEAAEAISAVFNRLGQTAAVIEEVWSAPSVLQRDGVCPAEQMPGGRVPRPSPLVRVKMFLPAEQSCALPRIEQALWHLGQLYPIPPPSVRWLAEEDWANAWKSGYRAFRIGRRIVVKPSWLSRASAPDEIVIELDPGMAFGTGLHPSTRLILEALESQLEPGARVLDVGTGSGILAIAAARLGASDVLALDIDRRALQVAQENIARNGVQDRISLQRASLIPASVADDPESPPQVLDAYGRWKGFFDLLLMNILAGVIIRSAEPIAACLGEGGQFVVSGILQSEEEKVRQALSGAGLNVVKRRKKKDWVALIGAKQSQKKDAI